MATSYEMREYIANRYSRRFANSLHDEQLLAVYLRLQYKPKPKKLKQSVVSATPQIEQKVANIEYYQVTLEDLENGKNSNQKPICECYNNG